MPLFIKKFGSYVLIYLLSFFTFSCSQAKDISTDEYINHVHTAIHQAWPKLGKVWNTDAYNKLRLLVADGKRAWTIDAEGINRVAFREVKNRHLDIEENGYSKIDWPDHRPTIYVSMGKSLSDAEKSRFESKNNAVPSVFDIATHEAFHMFVQDERWTQTDKVSENTRATAYPLDAAPRIYRNHIIRALYASLEGDSNGIGHARYWYDMWRNSYPDEVANIKQTDILEGSAKYIEVVAGIVSQGVRLDSDEFNNEFVKRIRTDALIAHTSADQESYTIGALAGFILNKKNSQWQSSIVRGSSPLELILSNVAGIQQVMDGALEKAIRQDIDHMTSVIGPHLDQFVIRYKRDDVLKIILNQGRAGSMTLTGGFFRMHAFPYELMVGASFNAVWDAGTYRISDLVVADTNKSAYCNSKDGGYLLLYPVDQARYKNGRLAVNEKNITIDAPYYFDKRQSNVICVGYD